jgi:hypothetical protein
MKFSGFIGLAIAALLLSTTGASEAATWEKSFDLGLNVTQAAYSDSWTGGEQGLVTWVSNANGTFNRQMSEMFRLKNTVKLSFGQTVTQDKDTKEWSKPEKTSDKIDLESVGLFDIKAWVEPFVALRFESQFIDASNVTAKKYINPILLTESAGIAKQLLKNEKNDIMTRFGVAVKQNINRNIIDPDNPEGTITKSSTDGGLEWNTDAKMVFANNLAYIGKLTAYKAFYFSKKDDFKGTEEDYWKTVDINWENSIAAQITKFVQVTFYTQLLYDKQISKKGRLKETLALGVTYKLF